MASLVVRDILAVIKICKITARTEIRETLDNDLQLLMYVGLIASTTLVLFGAAEKPGAYQYGAAALNGGELPVQRTIETIVVSVWVFGVLMFGFESATDQESVDREFLFLNASESVFVLGRSLARFIKYGDWVIVFSIIASGLFALGAQSILAFITLIVGILLTFFGAALLGSLGGSIVRYATVRVKIKIAFKYAAVMSGLLTFFLLFLNREQFYTYVLDSPISWYADLILLGVPSTTSDIAAASLAAVTTIILIPILAYSEYRVMLLIRTKNDKQKSTTEETETFKIENSLPWVSHKLYATLKSYLVLTVRRPRSAIFIMVGPATGYYLATNLLQGYSGGFEMAVIYALALTAGVGPTLNLIGNEERTLTQYLTTPNGERVLLCSYIGGALLIALVLLVAVLVGLVYRGDRLSVWRIIGAVALTAMAPFVSLTTGLLFSGYSKAKDGERTNYIPHILALISFIGAVSVVAMPFITGALRPDLFASYSSFVSVSQAEAVGAIITLLASAFLAGVCYWYSVRNLQKRYVNIVF